MNIAQIENNLQKLTTSFSKETFVYDLLLSYGLPKASIARLKNGNLNLSKNDGEIVWKKKLVFRVVQDDDLHETIDNLRNDSKLLKHAPRFIVVTDNETLLAVDTKTDDTLDIEIKDLPKHYDFFLPWAGMEKAQHQDENPADVKAAERMAKLFDEIKTDNPNESPEFVHGLNVFLSRLLFCFFAEDTNIFEKAQFTTAISSHTQADGSDLNAYLDKLFEVLNTEKKNRKNLPAYMEAFPYVNGGLFRDKYQSPVFTKRSRKAIIDSGELDWSAINPDIFGSMIQAVITPEHRGGLGMHYTSVPNIMKVIEPLFLNELYEEFEQAKGNAKKLDQLLDRLKNIKIFDPACGSGNFLIIAYKELRKLEIKIFKSLSVSIVSSVIKLDQFYGIELDDFAHGVTILSLWLAEHQMNIEFFNEFGRTIPTLPLKDAGHITHGNATRLNWEEVCPKNKGDEIYILGNPPYLGARNQDKLQKSDMELVFNGKQEYKDSDYVICWFLKASRYIRQINSKYAFVTTSSISQGTQISYYWPEILSFNQEICFAYQPFRWSNNAKDRAGVVCVIIGIQNKANNIKKLYTLSLKKDVNEINPYLVEGKTIIVEDMKKPISVLPKMVMGTMARDGSNLILSEKEKDELLSKYPETNRIIKRFLGSEEYIRGKLRYCLWIEDEDLEFANSIPEIKKRIDNVYEFRISSKAKTTNQYSKMPHKFAQRSHKHGCSIIVPRVSSERREYIPFGFLDENTVISDSAQAIFNPDKSILGVLLSKIHNIWVKSVGGYLGTSIRYSTSICYNTFPFHPISNQRKEEITQCVFRILEEREKHSEKTLAQLYDPNKMPESLRNAHHQLDLAVESCYRSKPFENDGERLEYLFKLYEQMIADGKAKDTLFAEQKKTRRKKE